MRLLTATLLSLLSWPAASAGELPNFFVYLRDVDSTIAQDIRYAGSRNFMGTPAPGYLAAECILTSPAAQALKAVQARLRVLGLGLVVFDCYRPGQAVASLVEWAADADMSTKEVYYPTLPKDRLLDGYIAGRSAHSRGSTVDLSIVRLGQQRPAAAGTVACNDPAYSEIFDGGIDMGTGFDCFDEMSHTVAGRVSDAAMANRKLLVDVMAAAGFENYHREWWHFQFVDEPYRKTFFDFPIEPR